MEWEPVRRVLSIFWQTVIFLFVILQGLCAYGLAAILVSSVAQCGYLFCSVVVAGPGVSSGLARFFFSQDFLLLVRRAINTQIASTIFVRSFATLYLDEGLFRVRAMAILADLRNRTVPTFFKAVAVVSGYSSVFWAAFRLLHVPAEIDLTLKLLGGAAYLAGTVAIAVVCQCRLASAVPVLEDASDILFGSMRRGLALIGSAKFFAAAGVFTLLDVIFIAVTVLTAFPSQVLAEGTAINAVLCTVVALTLVAQPVLCMSPTCCNLVYAYNVLIAS